MIFIQVNSGGQLAAFGLFVAAFLEMMVSCRLRALLFFLLVHFRCSKLPFDQDWTKVMKTALYADLLFILFLPLGWHCCGTFLQKNRICKLFSEQQAWKL